MDAVPAEVHPLAIDPTVPAAPRWRRSTMLVFRFFFAYLLIYNVPAFLQVVAMVAGPVEGWVYRIREIPFPKDGPFAYRPSAFVQKHMRSIVPAVWDWVPDNWKGGELAKKITVFPAGSGDTTYNYAEVGLFILVAALITGIWTLLSRQRANHARLHGMLRVYLRYVLAVAMIGYGMAKVIPLQMPGPDPYRLTSTYGEMSPMGVLWAFIGTSKAYSVFGGVGEALAGLLLLWRRTATLGALLAIGVLANVVAMNFCYDVPVKLYSSHLLLMAVVLVAPYVPRLATVLLTNRALPPGFTRPLFAARWLHYSWGVAKGLLLVAYMTQQVTSGIEAYHTYGDGASLPPLYGLYRVESHLINDEEQSPVLTNSKRWRQVIIGKIYPWGDGSGSFRAQDMTDTPHWYQYKLDTKAQTITISGAQRRNARVPGSTQPSATQAAGDVLTYREPDADHLVLEGKLGDDDIVVSMVRRPLDKFPLVSRGFHWVNEYPFNR